MSKPKRALDQSKLAVLVFDMLTQPRMTVLVGASGVAGGEVLDRLDHGEGIASILNRVHCPNAVGLWIWVGSVEYPPRERHRPHLPPTWTGEWRRATDEEAIALAHGSLRLVP